MHLPELLDRTVSLLYPQRCLGCADLVEYDDLFCRSCPGRAAGPLTLPFSHRLAGVAAVYEYKGHGRGLVWAIKAGERRVNYILGYDMHALINDHWGAVSFGAIVPVPATQTKLEAQGFNHAELLARELGRQTGIPACPQALVRAEGSLIQHSLDRSKRRENAERSYQTGEAGELAGKTILLVDDLLTTGATLAACAERLLESETASVYAIAAATTPSR